MRARIAIVGVVMLMSLAATLDSHENPFGFLEPTIQLSGDDKADLDQRRIVLRILPATGHELAVLAAGSIDVTPDAFVSSVRNISGLKKGALVPQIGRFSAEPRLEDLQQLTLDDVDIAEIRRCRPEHCGLKLTPDEVVRLQRAANGDESNSTSVLTTEFRRVVVDRANAYLRAGDELTPAQFSTLVGHSPYVEARVPALARYLLQYPRHRLPGAESFLYWSKETYAWKPMITVTHVTIVRGDSESRTPEVLVISRDVLSTRYTSGSLILTMLLRDAGSSSSNRYLVYVNRTWVDGVRALWRPFVEHRVKAQARTVFDGVRERLERDASASLPRR